MYVPHQIFERRPLLVFFLGFITLIISLFGFALIFREYRGFGKTPAHVDLTTVTPPKEMHGIWMEVTQPLALHCEAVETENPAEQQIIFGRVDSTYFLAEIPGSRRVVILEHSRKAACSDVQRAPMTGVLTELNSTLRGTLESRGMVFPRNCFPMLLCLSCGPRNSLIYLFLLLLMIVLSLWLATRSWRKYQEQATARERKLLVAG